MITKDIVIESVACGIVLLLLSLWLVLVSGVPTAVYALLDVAIISVLCFRKKRIHSFFFGSLILSALLFLAKVLVQLKE